MQDNSKNSKNGIRGYIALAVVFVVFSVIAFAAPFIKSGTFWISYIFGVLAIAYQIYIFKISFTKDGAAKSKFYGFPIARVGVIYLAVQLVVSIIEFLVAGILPLWIAIIINIFPLAYAVLGCVVTDAMREEIERQDVQLKKDVSNMRALQSLSASLVGMCSDESVKAIIQKMSDEFKYSDPVSSEQTGELESELHNQLDELQKALLDGDYSSIEPQCSKIIANLSERNRLCALNK